MGIAVQHLDHAIWGPCVFLEGEGDPEEIRKEYARQAPGWPPLHFAVAAPEALDPWYRLGFAQMHAYGERESGAERVEVPGVTIRLGGIDDLETAIRIDRVIHDTQAATPSFSTAPEVSRDDWIETLEGSDVAYFVAERAGKAVGHGTVYTDPHVESALHLGSTAVLPEAQGCGIGLLLASHALEHARVQGYPTLRTNWRVTNLQASRFWPARGFRITRIRLVRQLPTL